MLVYKCLTEKQIAGRPTWIWVNGCLCITEVWATRRCYDIWKKVKENLKGKSKYTLKMLGCFNPTLGQTGTNMDIGLHFYITFLTQPLGLSIFYPKLG